MPLGEGLRMVNTYVTRTGRFGRVIAVVCAIVLTVIAGAAVPADASSTNNLCGFGIFIGVRGTNAAAGSSLAHGNRVWLSGGFGDQVADLKSILASSTDAIPYFFESLNYPASGDIGIIPSEIAGRTNLVNELNWLSNQCGASLPAVVLAGHSQGALVIEDALQYNGAYPNLTTKARP